MTPISVIVIVVSSKFSSDCCCCFIYRLLLTTIFYFYLFIHQMSCSLSLHPYIILYLLEDIARMYTIPKYTDCHQVDIVLLLCLYVQFISFCFLLNEEEPNIYIFFFTDYLVFVSKSPEKFRSICSIGHYGSHRKNEKI